MTYIIYLGTGLANDMHNSYGSLSTKKCFAGLARSPLLCYKST